MKKYNRICVMCPTYGRANDKLPVFIQTILETVSNVRNICFSFIVNTEDKESEHTINRMCKSRVDYEIHYESLEKPHLAKYYNQAYDNTRFKENSTLVSMFGDDMEFKTKSWDLIFLEWANIFDGIGIFFGDDMKGTGDNLCVHFVTSRLYIDAQKPYPFMCEMFPCDDMDVIHNFTAKKIGRKFYIPEIKIFHNHATLPNRMDETWRRLRTTFPEVEKNRKSQKRDGHVWGNEDYENECIKLIKKNLPQYFKSELSVMMTTCDRLEELQETVTSYNQSDCLPEEISIFDDCSTESKMVRRIVGNMHGAELYVGKSKMGCTVNNLNALQYLFEKGAKAVLVLDSDTAFHRQWWNAANHFYRKMKNVPDCGILSIFNSSGFEPNVPGEKHLVQKMVIGGLGMIVTKNNFEKFVLPIIKTATNMVAWDNQLSQKVHNAGLNNYCMTPSFIQHMGIYEGIHVAGNGAAVASDYIGEVHTYQRYAKNTDASSRGVLFACMGRYGDIILVSMLANQLIEMGQKLTWLTIPKYYNLVTLICPEAKINIAPGNPQAHWQTTNTKEMLTKYKGFKYYINAQPGSPEHHNTLLGCGLSTAVYMRKVVERIIGLPLDKDLPKYLKLGYQRQPRFVFKEGKPLCIIATQNISAPNALPAERANKLYNKYSNKYTVKFLVPKKPQGLPIREVKKKYLYGFTFEECIEILKKAKLFIGNDSGLSWAALYSKECKKIVYHTSERMKLVNNRFADFDKNATDVIVDK